jgi:hypothetical protein
MSCSLVELANSDLKKADIEEALSRIYLKGLCTRALTCYRNKLTAPQDAHSLEILTELNSIIRIPELNFIQASCESLGATPLNQALIASRQLLIDFKAKHAIQKLNLITLCDGDAVDLNAKYCYTDERCENEKKAAEGIEYDYSKINIRVGKDIIKTHGRVYVRSSGLNPEVRTKDKKLTSKIISSIKKQVGITTQGFFVADTNSQFNYKVIGSYHAADSSLTWDYDTNDTIKKKAQKEYRKSKCVEIHNTNGYDNYFLVKGGSDLSIDSQFDVDKDAKTSQIKNAFVKYSKGKKTNKVLLEKFARSIC